MELLDYFFLGLLSGAGLFYVLGTCFLLRYHLRRRPQPDAETPVTVLKPLAGLIRNLEPALESFMLQSHKNVQIIFGIGRPDDPAREVAEALIRKYPQVDASVVVAGELIGPNRKVTSLHYMLSSARHDLLMICDDDLVAHRDFVSRMVAELKDPQVGLATATYWSVPGNLPTAMHSLTMATEFFPSVVTAEAMEGGISFALGPASILRRKFLEDLGGFASMANYLAEDYLMGAWGRQKGWRIHLSRESVQIGDHFSSLWDFLVHQLRWSRTYRVCRPFGFFLSVLTQGMFFALLYLVLGGCDPESVMGAIGLVSLRQLAAGLQIMMRGPKRLIFWWWLVPIRDLLSVLFWALSFLGNRVRWRENVFRLSYEGRLEPLDSR